jgi:hypothetical protein
MAIIASAKGSSIAREPIPAGAYAARCYSIVDLGTREEVIQGNAKVLRKVRVTFELPTERRVFNEEKGEQPCVISKEFNLVLSEKSTLRAFLRSWRGKDFTEAEAKAFDVAKLIGAPCLLNIIHVAGKANPSRMYDEISSVSPLPKGMVCPPQENPSFEFSLDEYDQAAFDSLPNFLKEKVSGSFEFRDLLAKGVATMGAAPAQAAAPAPAPAPAAAKPAAASSTPLPKFTPPTVISAPGLQEEIDDLPF